MQRLDPASPPAAEWKQTIFVQMTTELLGDHRRQTVDTRANVGVAAGHIEIADFAQIDHSG